MQSQDVVIELILANRCGIWSWREPGIEISGVYSRVNHQFTESFENFSYSNFCLVWWPGEYFSVESRILINLWTLLMTVIFNMEKIYAKWDPA